MSTLTEKKLNNAFLRIKKGRTKNINKNRKMSITAVAEEAGFKSGSIIHNHYPEIKLKISKEVNSGLITQRNNKINPLKHEKNKNKDARSEIEKLKSNLNKLASINAALHAKITDLESEKDLDNFHRL